MPSDEPTPTPQRVPDVLVQAVTRAFRREVVLRGADADIPRDERVHHVVLTEDPSQRLPHELSQARGQNWREVADQYIHEHSPHALEDFRRATLGVPIPHRAPLSAMERLFMLRNASRMEAELAWLRNNNYTVCEAWKDAKRAGLSDTTAAELALICLARVADRMRRGLGLPEREPPRPHDHSGQPMALESASGYFREGWSPTPEPPVIWHQERGEYRTIDPVAWDALCAMRIGERLKQERDQSLAAYINQAECPRCHVRFEPMTVMHRRRAASSIAGFGTIWLDCPACHTYLRVGRDEDGLFTALLADGR